MDVEVRACVIIQFIVEGADRIDAVLVLLTGTGDGGVGVGRVDPDLTLRMLVVERWR